MLLGEVIRSEIVGSPLGPPLSIQQVASVLGVSAAHVVALARDGLLGGRLEDGRVISIDRRSVLQCVL